MPHRAGPAWIFDTPERFEDADVPDTDKPLKSFTNVSRVRVIEPGPFCGITGTVWRKLIRDSSAWIALDNWPEGDTSDQFPADDDRRNHKVFFPDECTEV